MNLSPILSLFQGETGSVVVAVILAIIGSGGLATIITYFLTRGKTKAETLGLNQKNQKQIFENFDFENDVLNDAANEIKRLRKRELELTGQIHEKDIKIKGLEIDVAEKVGQVKLISSEKEIILRRVDELKDEMEKKDRECIKKIQELTDNHQSQLDFLRQQILGLEEKLKGYEIGVDK